MKILRIKLCYPDGDKIIINKEVDLGRYDLSQISSMDIEYSMTLEQFKKLKEEYDSH